MDSKGCIFTKKTGEEVDTSQVSAYNDDGYSPQNKSEKAYRQDGNSTQNYKDVVVNNAINGEGGSIEFANVDSVANGYVENQTAKVTNDQTIHKGSNLGIDVATDTFGAITYVQTIKAKQAELIDNYFNAYGYAINKVSYFSPSRSRFDYVETAGNIFRRKSEGAGVPNLAIDKLNSVANSGIRIWHSISELNRGNLVDRNSIR